MKQSELRQLIREEISSLKKEEMDDVTFEKLDQAVSNKIAMRFVDIGIELMENLTNKGFEPKDIYKYMYQLLLNNA